MGGRTEISILDVTAGFPFGFYNIVALFGKVLNEHLGSKSDNEGSGVGADVDILIDSNHLPYSRYCIR
jgi:hypothetical protein